VVTFKQRDTNRAQSLRNEATPAERELWKFLNKRQVSGYKFSRQMPVGPYFADFLCRELNVIVEIDGISHDVQQSYDARRTKALEDHGYRVIRFTNRDVMENIEGVVQQIETLISDMPTLNPSREREGNC
jgi:very-short-patch-repair endonuclease